MTRRTRRRLILCAVMIAVSVAAAPLYKAQFASRDADLVMIVAAFFFGGFSTWGIILLYLPSQRGEFFRRLSFPARLAGYCAFVVAIVMLGGFLAKLVMTGEFDLLVSGAAGWKLFAFVGVLILLLLFAAQMLRIIGPRVLGNILIGRYHTPVAEERAFLFVDLVGSTALAERMGDIGVQQLLTCFFFDIGEPVLEHDGEIHAYIGDEVIITWPLARAVSNAECIRCFFAIRDEIDRRADGYQDQFGVVPRIRGALHGGTIVVGECGDFKKAIVYFGDTMNTVARLEGEAKRLDQELIASGDILNRMELPADIVAQQFGEVTLRGRQAPTVLVGLSRRGAFTPNPDNPPA